MSIADTLTTAAEAYVEKLSEVVKTPDFSITLGGVALTELADRITSLSVTDNNGFDADQLTLSVDDSDGVTDLPPRGAELAVSIGWLGEALIYKGLYTVDEVGHSGPPDVIDITAHSADFREEMNVRREVSWHDLTVERVVSAIARRYDLKPMISEALIDIEIDHADQTEESDMSFLTRMAEMLGAIATVKNGCLLFILPGGGVSASGRALPSAEITRARRFLSLYRLTLSRPGQARCRGLPRRLRTDRPPRAPSPGSGPGARRAARTAAGGYYLLLLQA